MLDEIRWGILGCGDVTERKSGPAFNKVPGSRLVAVMRRDAGKAADYARRHQVPTWFSDADALIEAEDVNAVYIATPPGSHCELALRVAAAGKPCYVEKPMARTGAECLQMVEAFERAGLPLFVAYYRRALPHFMQVKSLIDSGKLGRLMELRYRFASGRLRDPSTLAEWRFQPEHSGGGLFWDLGSHALDLFDFWLGPLDTVRGSTRKFHRQSPVEEWAGLQFEAGGAQGSASWNFVSPVSEDTIRLTFELGEITCSCFGPSTIYLTDFEGATSQTPFELPENIQLPLITQMVSALRTGSPAVNTGAAAMRTNQVIDQVARI